MKYIEKRRREPESLSQYRATPGAYYDGYRDKDELLHDKEISVDPTKPDCEKQVKFSFSGIGYLEKKLSRYS